MLLTCRRGPNGASKACFRLLCCSHYVPLGVIAICMCKPDAVCLRWGCGTGVMWSPADAICVCRLASAVCVCIHLRYKASKWVLGWQSSRLAVIKMPPNALVIHIVVLPNGKSRWKHHMRECCSHVCCCTCDVRGKRHAARHAAEAWHSVPSPPQHARAARGVSGASRHAFDD